MLDSENRGPKAKRIVEDPPQWLTRLGVGGLTEEEFYDVLKMMIHSGECRALRKVLWMVLQHRFQSGVRVYENLIAAEGDPERLLAAFKKALIIERIQDLHF